MRHWQAHSARLQERLRQGEAEIRISPVGIARLGGDAAGRRPVASEATAT
ncbi:hypothetical protein [Streptomyces sp. NPDC097640]